MEAIIGHKRALYGLNTALYTPGDLQEARHSIPMTTGRRNPENLSFTAHTLTHSRNKLTIRNRL